VLGTLNNCANGYTPWGTYLTCEENFNGYFGWNGTRTPTKAPGRESLRHHAEWLRLPLAHRRPALRRQRQPNEPNRFGWVVEIDPFAPASKPVKRTALGRFKHENAELVIAANGKVVVYMGDDERNEYIYKFVSSGKFDPPTRPAPPTATCSTDGTLYVAKFDAGATPGDNMGTGVWIPLVHRPERPDAANGFASQAEVLIKTRQAADRVGATMMDRPEWVAANPKKPGEVYCTLTNNNRRGGTTPNDVRRQHDGAGSARPPVDEANPRANNVWGHIVRWNETGGDAAPR
jgi:uncharacterized protein